MAARDKKLVVGNWKMNLGVHEASLYVHKLASLVKTHRNMEVVLAPTTLALQSLSLQVDHKQFKLAAQNLYWRDEGAFTGEVSARQLHGIAQYAIIGHSERRHIFGEHDKDIRSKVQAAVRNGIDPILCIGETASERADGETKDVIHDQLTAGLANITSEELDKIVIAYEPVWAIGTGVTATPEQIDDVISFIRRYIAHLFGEEASQSVRVLYGAGVEPDHVAAIVNLNSGVDGLLVGGASLDGTKFNAIIEQVHKAGTKVARK